MRLLSRLCCVFSATDSLFYREEFTGSCGKSKKMFPPPHFPFLSLRGRKLKVSLIVGARVNCLLALFPTCMLFVCFQTCFFPYLSLATVSNNFPLMFCSIFKHFYDNSAAESVLSDLPTPLWGGKKPQLFHQILTGCVL